MRCRDSERTLVLSRVLARGFLDVARAFEGALGVAMDFASGRAQSDEPLAIANEQFDFELALEELQLPAQPRLRHMQRFSRSGDIEILTDDFTEVAQLLECHWSA